MTRLALALAFAVCSAAPALAGDYGSWRHGGDRYYSHAYTTYVSPTYTIGVTKDYPWPGYGAGYRVRDWDPPYYSRRYRHRHYGDLGYGYRDYGGHGYGRHSRRYYGGHYGYRARQTCVVYNRRGVQVVVRSRGRC